MPFSRTGESGAWRCAVRGASWTRDSLGANLTSWRPAPGRPIRRSAQGIGCGTEKRPGILAGIPVGRVVSHGTRRVTTGAGVVAQSRRSQSRQWRHAPAAWTGLVSERAAGGRPGVAVCGPEAVGLASQRRDGAGDTGAFRGSARAGVQCCRYDQIIAGRRFLPQSRHLVSTGSKPDYAQAAKWFRKAAEMGDPQAQLALGLLYWSGRGMSKTRRPQWLVSQGGGAWGAGRDADAGNGL